jgi:glycosyltransferase involved in cell wall biosynthesis
VEALASGRPVVAKPGADAGRLLVAGVNGGRSETRDPGELAELIRASESVDPARCRATVDHQSAPEIVDRILARQDV